MGGLNIQTGRRRGRKANFPFQEHQAEEPGPTATGGPGPALLPEMIIFMIVQSQRPDAFPSGNIYRPVFTGKKGVVVHHPLNEVSTS